MPIRTTLLCVSLAPLLAGYAAVQTFPLTDAKGLMVRDAHVEPAVFHGRKAVRLTREGSGEAAAFLPGVEFQDGTIEADLAVKVTAPAGARHPGFLGIAFRTRDEGKQCELFYIRPGNSHAADQAMRNHTVQYVASPGYGWERLRREWPWVYEAHADLELETWAHVKIEVQGRRASLFINSDPNPALVVDGLKGSELKGGVALWGYGDEESYFANVRVTHAAPAPIANSGEPSGSWQLNYSSDSGAHSCLLTLKRDGSKLTGSLAGLYKAEVPVTGEWRDGYIELWFHGAWPKSDSADASATLAGWVDGDAAKGRLIVTSKADGVWTATRKP